MKAAVYLVDDDASVRRSLGRVLAAHGLETRGFASGDEFLQQFDPAAPGCLLLDLEMPGLSGLELQQTLSGLAYCPPILFLSGRASVRTSVSAMKVGAVDFLTKPVDAEVLVAAINLAMEKDRLARDLQQERDRIQRCIATLTPREREVLPHMLSGRLGKQIAGDLNIVEKTVKVHRSRIMHKLEAKSVAELVRLAGRVGIQPAAP